MVQVATRPVAMPFGLGGFQDRAIRLFVGGHSDHAVLGLDAAGQGGPGRGGIRHAGIGRIGPHQAGDRKSLQVQLAAGAADLGAGQGHLVDAHAVADAQDHVPDPRGAGERIGLCRDRRLVETQIVRVDLRGLVVVGGRSSGPCRAGRSRMTEGQQGGDQQRADSPSHGAVSLIAVSKPIVCITPALSMQTFIAPSLGGNQQFGRSTRLHHAALLAVSSTATAHQNAGGEPLEESAVQGPHRAVVRDDDHVGLQSPGTGS